MTTWTSPAVLAPEQRRTFEDLLAYCVPNVHASVCEHGDAGTTVRFAEQPGWQSTRLLDGAFERALLAPARPPKVVLDMADIDVDSVIAPADVTDVGPGLRVAGPGLARLMRALDKLFLGIALDLGADEHAVPHLVSWSTIDRGGYAKAFPQHLTACSVVGPDLDALDRFAGAADRAAALTHADVVLAPAVCLHLFAALADQRLTGPFLATARGMCGRHEANAAKSETRLWSFDMREIVFVGDPMATRRFRDRMLDALADLVRRLALPCQLLTASDPFFTDQRQQLLSYQSSFDLKYELCGHMADGRRVAVTSLNLHKQHFGVGFGITLPEGGSAHSACVGFGLERWAHWIHGHVGDNPADWPDPLGEMA